MKKHTILKWFTFIVGSIGVVLFGVLSPIGESLIYLFAGMGFYELVNSAFEIIQISSESTPNVKKEVN